MAEKRRFVRARIDLDQRGSVSVEYVVVLVVVAVVIATTLVGVGAPLMRMVEGRQALLLLPFP